MDTWTLQSGYPLLNVTRISATQINITQEQFVQNGIPSGDEMWWIPIEIQVLVGPSPGTKFFWMRNDEKTITVDIGEDELFYVNPESIGNRIMEMQIMVLKYL